MNLMTVPEVAGELGVSERLVWRLITDGDLPSLKVGGLRRIRRDDLEAYVTPARQTVSMGA